MKHSQSFGTISVNRSILKGVLLSRLSAIFALLLPGVISVASIALFGSGNSNIFASEVRNANKSLTNNNAVVVDPNFDPSVDTSTGNARAVLMQPDGKVLIAGSFKSINGVPRNGIVRLNADRSIDVGFDANIDGLIQAIAQQSDGKIIVGGSFTDIGGVGRNNIARLNTDGSIDESFYPATGANGAVSDLFVQADGKIVVGGSFTNISNTFRNYIARLNADGSVDATFTSPFPSVPPPNPNPPPSSIPSVVNTLALQPDGKILVGGRLYLSYDPQTIRSIVRINSDGTYDNAFVSATVSSTINKLALQPDGKIIIGGAFTNVGGMSRRYIARLNTTGSLDQTFDAGQQATGTVTSLYLRTDGKILFGSFISQSETVLRQLNPDGSFDLAFTSDVSVFGTPFAITQLSDGKILAAGSLAPVSGTPNTVFIFNTDGSSDLSFQPNFSGRGRVRAVAVLSDGKVLIGGIFDRVNGLPRRLLTRLDPDGTIDEGFAAGSIFGFEVTVLLIQPDGKILVGGRTLAAVPGPGRSLFRLNPDGSVDGSFNQVEFSTFTTKALAIQADGRILMSYLQSVQDGREIGGLVRYNADGSLDNSFNFPRDFVFETLVALPNGQIIAGGTFGFGYVSPPAPTEFHNGVMRLNSDGSHDRTFRSNLLAEVDRYSSVRKVLLENNGKLLVGGSLYFEDSVEPAGLARFETNGSLDETFQRNVIVSNYDLARVEDIRRLQNGDLVVGGLFNGLGEAISQNLAFLNSDGVIDPDRKASADRIVTAIEGQKDGRIVVGGDFDSLRGVPRTSIGRLSLSLQASSFAPFDFDGDGKTDASIFRPNGSSSGAEWWYLRSSDGGNRAFAFGGATDEAVPADYTGDGKTDIAFWRASTGSWFILRSEDSTFYSFPFGSAGDVPMPADFDGDGKADQTVFRPSTNTWFTFRSSDGQVTTTPFGAAGDLPVAADYDGDGKADIAIYRPVGGSGGGEWWYLRSSDGANRAYAFGSSTDRAVPGDYTGDGKADLAFWRPSTGEWFVLRSEDDTFYSFPFGISTDVPVPGDYDGDGKADAAVFRPSNNIWYLLRSTAGFEAVTFGANGDVPLPNSYVR